MSRRLVLTIVVTAFLPAWAPAVLAKTQSFNAPMVGGVRLDWCAHFGNGCGKAAADLFCQQSGFSVADRFAIDENIGRRGVATMVLGDNRQCQGPTCSGFRVITCSATDVVVTPPPAILAPPPRSTFNPRPNAPILPTPPRVLQPLPAAPPPAPPPPSSSAVQDLSKRKLPSGKQGAPAGAPPNAAPINPAQLTRAICAANPIACCPGGDTTSNGCRTVVQALLDIRIRSYVPPRFITMGKNSNPGPGPNWAMADIVSDVKLDSPYKVWPGCRFDVNVANHAIEDSKSVFQQAGELAEAWLGQWSSGVEFSKVVRRQRGRRSGL